MLSNVFIFLSIVCTIKTGRSQPKPQLTEVEGITVQPVRTVRQMEETQTTDNQPNYRCALIIEGAFNRFMVPSRWLIKGMPVWLTLSEDGSMSSELLYTKNGHLILEDAPLNKKPIIMALCNPQPLENNCFTKSPFRLYSWDSPVNMTVATTWVHVAHHPVNLLCRPSFGRILGYRYIQPMSSTRSLYDCAKQVMEDNKGSYGVEWEPQRDVNGTCYALKGASLSVDIHLPNIKVNSGDDLGATLACVLECNKISVGGEPNTGQVVDANSFEDCLDEGYRRQGVSMTYSYLRATHSCIVYNTTYYTVYKGWLGCDIPPPPPIVDKAPFFSVDGSIFEISTINSEPLTITTVAPSISRTVAPSATTTVAPSTTTTVAPSSTTTSTKFIYNKPWSTIAVVLVVTGGVLVITAVGSLLHWLRPDIMDGEDDWTNDSNFDRLYRENSIRTRRSSPPIIHY